MEPDYSTNVYWRIQQDLLDLELDFETRKIPLFIELRRNLNAYRKDKNLTYKEMEKLTGISGTLLNDMATGRREPSSKALTILADKLN